MAQRPLRPLEPSEHGTRLYDRWLGQLSERLSEPSCDRDALCIEVLRQIYFPGLPDDVDPDDLPLGTRVALQNLDPGSATLEPEYYHELDPDRFAPRKPLLWLWQMFDRSPLGGNVHLGVRFRRILAQHVFERVGENFKCFHFVEVSFGYNLVVGDNVVVHRNVLLDDRGGIELGNNVSISDHAAIFSHTHSIDDIVDVTNKRTVLGDNVRITVGATVLAGVQIGTQAMVGARALATRDVPPFHVAVGIPAKPLRVKSIAPAEVREQSKIPVADPGGVA